MSTFTGRHMAAIMIAFFAVVIVVNVFMARMASSTFGGVVVENSYVASQNFNRWLDEAEAEKGLGWELKARRTSDGRVAIALSGPPIGVAALAGVARHPLGREPDRALKFFRRADGLFESREALPAGRWLLRVEVAARGKVWRNEGEI
jgi:nitrogen fixation protein FixH